MVNAITPGRIISGSGFILHPEHNEILCAYPNTHISSITCDPPGGWACRRRLAPRLSQ